MKKTNIIISLCLILGLSSNCIAADHVIGQKDKEFSTNTISVKVGDTLIFENNEADITHNVYSLSPGNSFELKTQKPGEKSDVILTAGKHSAGTMVVECAIHPNMRLEVNIE